MKGLIIKDPWITKILNGEKPWEIRGSRTKIRETISLIKSGTGKVFGTVDLVDCRELQYWELEANQNKHLITDMYDLQYMNPFAWVLEHAVWHPEPIPYKHPQGAVIWVNL